MKKVWMAVLAMGLFGAAARAEDGRIAIGVQGGVVFTDFSRENTPVGLNYDNNNGWLGGAYAEFGVWTITLRPEVNYVETGYTVGSVAEVTNKYLEIPLLVKVNPLSDFMVSPFILFGPSWSRHLSTDVNVLGFNANFRGDNSDDFWSGVLGAGVEFNIFENAAFNVQARYNFGLSDTDTSTQEVKSRSVYALAGLTFTL